MLLSFSLVNIIHIIYAVFSEGLCNITLQRGIVLSFAEVLVSVCIAYRVSHNMYVQVALVLVNGKNRFIFGIEERGKLLPDFIYNRRVANFIRLK